MTEKHININQLADLLKNENQTTCFVSGNFNILHPGHLRFLMFAAEQADVLVVGLYLKDFSDGAFISDDERLMAINSLQIVDHVVLISDDLKDVITALKPEVIVKGKEFENAENPELDFAKSYGGKLLFSSGERTFSSRALLLEEKAGQYESSVRIEQYAQRNSICISDLHDYIAKFSRLNVTVIGDIIVDEYQECEPIGMSQEDPTIAVSPTESFKFLGGAGIVAAHSAQLGANVKLLSVSGNDSLSLFAKTKLDDYGVKHYLVEDSTRPTTHKLRYRAKEKTLLRVNKFRKHDIESGIVTKLFSHFTENCFNSELVIFSDFNYGLLCQKLIEKFQTFCQKNSILMVADSQTSSQLGDLNKFKNLILTTPTEIEARGAVGDEKSGLVQVCSDLGEKLNSENVIVTMGSEGSIIHHNNGVSWETDKLPAFSSNAIDSAGAGDALFVTTSMMIKTGASIWESALLGSIAAAIQVNIKGNVPLQRANILTYLKNMNI